MNAKHLLFFIVIFLPVALGVQSCKKSTGAATPSENVVGTWRKAEYAYDNNNSGQIISSDIEPQPASIVQKITFNANGTGVENDVDDGEAQPPLAFMWTISTSDSLWVAYDNHDTITYYLNSISSSSLILTTFGPISPLSPVSVLQWYMYTKQ